MAAAYGTGSGAGKWLAAQADCSAGPEASAMRMLQASAPKPLLAAETGASAGTPLYPWPQEHVCRGKHSLNPSAHILRGLLRVTGVPTRAVVGADGTC